jgi:hypothetical protein
MAALARYALLDDDSDVTVVLDGTTVMLLGPGAGVAEHDAVVAAAWMADGVYEVHDGLVITG